MQPRPCYKCWFWGGNDQAYAADCRNPATANSRAEWDSSCARWESKPLGYRGAV